MSRNEPTHAITDPRWNGGVDGPVFVRQLGPTFGFTYEWANGVEWTAALFPDGKLRPVPARVVMRPLVPR